MKPYKRPESVLVVIYDVRSRVLVLQRRDDPNFWQSVTGTIELGEQPIETAYREVFEEIGISIAINANAIIDCQRVNQFKIRPEWQYRFPPDTQFNTEHVFKLCLEGTEDITLSEHLQYQWLAKDSAIKKVWSDSNRQGIQDFVPGAE